MKCDFQVASVGSLAHYQVTGRCHLVAFVVGIFLPMTVFGQTPVKVSLCELVKEPQKYSRQWVEIRGGVNLAFEDFTFDTSNCYNENERSQFRGIWLAYGGDEPTPTTSTAGDQARPQGAILKVDGIPVPLHRDENLSLFKRRLEARRMMRPGGSTCFGNCSLYRVTATFTGLFMASPATRGSGYGHMECCHLFTISQVKEVDAARTKVPAGGQFACSKETWEMDVAEATEILNRRPCTSVADCEKTVSEQFGSIAEHWQDPFDASHGTAYHFLTGAPVWVSADMLTTYMVSPHYSTKKHEKNIVLGATVTRTACKATKAPYPMSTPIGCRTLFSEFDVPGMKKTGAAPNIQSVESWPGTPESVAPQALSRAAKIWGVEPLPGLKLEECGKPMTAQGELFSWCEWSDPTAMQSLDIQVSHPQQQENAPWRLTRGDGMTCAAETQ